MNFNFNDVSTEVKESNDFAPFGIYKVKYAGCEDRTFNGTKEPDKSYHVMDFKFEGDEGSYTHTLFYPSEGDDERRVLKNSKGEDHQMPSRWDETKMFIAQLMQVLNPDGWTRFQKASVNIKTPEQMFAVVAKLMEKVVGKETNIKIIGRQKNGVWIPVIPSFCAISTKEHNAVYMSEYFIGDNLKFNNWEQQKMNEYKSGSASEPTTPSEENLDEIYGDGKKSGEAEGKKEQPAPVTTENPKEKAAPVTASPAPAAAKSVGKNTEEDDISKLLGC